MAVDLFPKLKELTLKHPDKGILSFIANGVIKMWSPVVLIVPPAGEKLPRVGTTTTTNDPLVIGIAAGGSGDVANGNAADEAGDVVDVIPIHSAAITKVRVNTSTVDIGSYLVTGATATQADFIADTTDTRVHVLGKSFQDAQTAADVLLIFMGGSM